MIGVAEQLNREIDFAPAVLIDISKPIFQLLDCRDRDWRKCLLIEVNFRVEEIDFSCHLVMLLSDDSIEHLRTRLLQFTGSF